MRNFKEMGFRADLLSGGFAAVILSMAKKRSICRRGVVEMLLDLWECCLFCLTPFQWRQFFHYFFIILYLIIRFITYGWCMVCSVPSLLDFCHFKYHKAYLVANRLFVFFEHLLTQLSYSCCAPNN